MTKVKVSKKVLKRAKKIVEAEVVEGGPVTGPLLPIAAFWYPRHGLGGLTKRFVRVLEMDHSHLRGFEINDEFDKSNGAFKTFSIDLIGGGGKVLLLHSPNPLE